MEHTHITTSMATKTHVALRQRYCRIMHQSHKIHTIHTTEDHAVAHSGGARQTRRSTSNTLPHYAYDLISMVWFGRAPTLLMSRVAWLKDEMARLGLR